MHRIILTAMVLLGAFSLCVGCRGGGGDDPNGSDADTDGDGNGSDGDSDGDADGDGTFQSCGTTDVNLSAVSTRVMLVEDKSGSMDQNAGGQAKWPQAVDAIQTMVDAFDNQIQFGLDLFNIGGDNARDSCEVGTSVVVDAALGNGQTIMDRLDATNPGSATPLLMEMRNFLDAAYAPVFSSAGANKYLVIVSDGMDTCGTDGIFDQNNGANAVDLAAAAAELSIDHGIDTIVVGFGSGADEDQLNAIAAAGGTTFDTYIEAGDGAALTDALTEIAQTVMVSCVFELDNYNPDEVNTDRVNVLFDDVAVPRDDECTQETGWMWDDNARTTIRFCDAACAKIEALAVTSIKVQIACPDDEVIVVAPI